MVKFHLLEEVESYIVMGLSTLIVLQIPKFSFFLALVAVTNYSVIKSSTGEITITPELVVPVLPDSFMTETT
jgi:hypothetical protein